MKNNKRIVSIALVITLLFTGVAYASSVNGLFEGFSIVNIFIDGKKIQGDVPAINFHGRTMVPVRFVSEELGANVEWDGNTASVYIDSSNTSGGLEKADLDQLKLISLIQHQYKYLSDTGQSLAWIGTELQRFSNTYANSTYSHDENMEVLGNVMDNISGRLEIYDTAVEATMEIIELVKSEGIDVSDMELILSGYEEAIYHYFDALDSLMKDYETGQLPHITNYKNSMILATDTLYEHYFIAVDGYIHYFSIVQEY